MGMIKTFGSRAGREAWGYTKVAQRAKKRFGKLHIPDYRLVGRGARGTGVRHSLEVIWRCLHNEVRHLWPHFWSIYFGKVITALKAALWSTHTDVWVIGKLKLPWFVHIAIFLPSSVSEPMLGLPLVQQGIYLPSLGPCSHLGACSGQCPPMNDVILKLGRKGCLGPRPTH